MNSSIWPLEFELYNSGCTNDQLKMLVNKDYILGFEKNTGIRRVPTFYWTTEIYSFGRCYREVSGWPYWLPIPVYGDHGVCFLSKFEPHELESTSRVHFSWYERRVNSLRDSNAKNVIHITHPWIAYRIKKQISVKSEAKGTLIFYSHSNVGIDVNIDDDEYFNDLFELDAAYKPFVVCLHQHDIDKGVHLRLRKYGLPIITMGYTNSFMFVDRFYDVVTQFKYATSPKGGSELFYCHEVGVKYFIYGRNPRYVNVSHKQKPLGDLESYECDLAKVSTKIKRDLFYLNSKGFDDVDSKQAFVSEVLGLRQLEVISGMELRQIFLKEMLLNWYKYLWEVSKKVAIRILGLRAGK